MLPLDKAWGAKLFGVMGEVWLIGQSSQDAKVPESQGVQECVQEVPPWHLLEQASSSWASSITYIWASEVIWLMK